MKTEIQFKDINGKIIKIADIDKMLVDTVRNLGATTNLKYRIFNGAGYHEVSEEMKESIEGDSLCNSDMLTISYKIDQDYILDVNNYNDLTKVVIFSPDKVVNYIDKTSNFKLLNATDKQIELIDKAYEEIRQSTLKEIDYREAYENNKGDYGLLIDEE